MGAGHRAVAQLARDVGAVGHAASPLRHGRRNPQDPACWLPPTPALPPHDNPMRMSLPDRKRIVFGVVAIVSAAWLYLFPPAFLQDLSFPGGSRSEPRASVILIVVDTLRADRLSLYGYSRDTSPRLLRRERQGRVFEHAFSTSSWTLPSVGSLLTGELPSRHGAGVRAAPDGEGVRAAPDEEGRWLGLDSQLPTIAEILRRRGFETGAIVTNSFLHPRFGVARGFETYDHGPSTHSDRRNAEFAVDRAIGWLQARDDRPFFLLLHLMDPHFPYSAPAPYGGRFASTEDLTVDVPFQPADILDLQRRIDDLGAPDRAYLSDAYDEEILFVDAQLDRLLASLEDDPDLSGRAVVLLTSDHGEEFFEHSGFEHGHTMYNELLHVPLVVWGPGVVSGRETVPASLVDLAPTVLEIAGVRPPSDLEGISLWPLLVRADASAPDRVRRRLLARRRLLNRQLVAEINLREPENKALIRWPHKAIVDLEAGTLLLYDIARDPGERDDIAARNPDLADELASALRLRVTEAALARSEGPGVTLDDKTVRDLRALGYIQ